MIDVDVVTDVNDSYALKLRGEVSRNMDCFVIGRIGEGADVLALAEPVRRHNLAISFSQSLGDFFFDFAEAHFHYDQGDDICLLLAKLDCANLDETMLLDSVRLRAEQTIKAGEGTILKRRKAMDSGSAAFISRVRRDIYTQNRLFGRTADLRTTAKD